MIEAMLSGLFQVFAWPAFGFLLLGIFIGLIIGVVPGLGGVLGLVILLPFTFGMEPVSAFALLLGMYAITSTSDTIASVLLGIPGTVASQATILDGYPMAKKGQASRAFGAAYTVSAFGGVLGALIMAASLPILLPLILKFGVAEFFMLAVLGLTMVGSISGRSVGKGLLVAALGLLLSTVGEAAQTGTIRFSFDTAYLSDRLPIIPIVLGLFGIPELLEMAVRNSSISKVAEDKSKSASMLQGVKDAIRYRWLAFRCALIGTYVGIIPGLGASIVDWIAYGHAVQSAKDKSQFGSGDIRGVIAPEAANNANRAGALIPTVAFGIPGSLGTAILLGALIIQGLKPGPEMLTDNLDLTFSMIWDLVIANIFAALLLMVWSRQIAKVAFMPGHLIVPGVLCFIMMGAWIASASIEDWWLCLLMGMLGYAMKQGGWPRPPIILAIVLGELMEENLHLSTTIYGGWGWMLDKPVVIIIEILIVATIIYSLIDLHKRRDRSLAHGGVVENEVDEEDLSEGSVRNPIMSLPLSILFLLLFCWAYVETQKFEEVETAQFPEAVILVAIPIAFITLISYFSAGPQDCCTGGKPPGSHFRKSPAVAILAVPAIHRLHSWRHIHHLSCRPARGSAPVCSALSLALGQVQLENRVGLYCCDTNCAAGVLRGNHAYPLSSLDIVRLKTISFATGRS